MATYAAFKHVELYNVGNTKKRVLKPPGGGSSDLFGADQLGPNTPRTMSKNRMQSNIFAAPADAHKNVFRQGAHRYYFLGSETPRRAAQGQDSHNRLFGELNRPFTPAKNHMKSNLPIGGDHTDGGKPHQNGKSNGVAHQNGNGTANGHHTNGHSNGNGHISSASSDNGSSHIFLRRLTSPRSPRSPRFAQRNPVTGNGVEDYADKPRKLSSRRGAGDGNPVTGEGYSKSNGAAEINTTVPSLNGGGHVINKNRIPPGGFSSGLW
ncbi:microtubule-associated protein Jupiter isoform X1 [Anopheles maculipalpis]|uniref:microtubule-associated protein Jupiter isoform X1 n=1 Tax=Anopheles maculipalpis TaxID=1496333 RepID=UPI00215930E1|nr:microtubule-associated protein Jupiter isoform X1 [Anopheles maculipalpis]